MTTRGTIPGERHVCITCRGDATFIYIHPGAKHLRKKATERKREEERIWQREAKLLASDSSPESAEDFERLLIASPNSSLMWIRYMAFQLSLADIDAARSVAERALRQINFRQEQEKLNVWVAFLNLEHKYGTPDTLAEVLKRAAQHNNPKHVYLHVADLYERAGEDDKAEEMFQVYRSTSGRCCYR